MDTLFEMPEVSNGSGKSNEWYTPTRFINAVYQVMGTIDLDPASCILANQTVRAKKYYTLEDDGLSKAWAGKVWCNPPFTASTSCPLPQLTWATKLVREYHTGNVDEAILLIMAASKQHWFHTLWRMHQGLVCFSEKRIHFNRPGNCTQELRESTCFVYLGPNEDKFIDIFSQFGTIAKRVSPPPTKPQTLDLWNDASLLTTEIASWDVPDEQREESVG